MASGLLPRTGKRADAGFAFKSLPLKPHNALQRVWRDFRIAICSRDRNDAPLPKIWTLACLRAHEREPWRRQ
jgi:hypothetical protein